MAKSSPPTSRTSGSKAERKTREAPSKPSRRGLSLVNKLLAQFRMVESMPNTSARMEAIIALRAQWDALQKKAVGGAELAQHQLVALSVSLMVDEIVSPGPHLVRFCYDKLDELFFNFYRGELSTQGLADEIRWRGLVGLYAFYLFQQQMPSFQKNPLTPSLASQFERVFPVWREHLDHRATCQYGSHLAHIAYGDLNPSQQQAVLEVMVQALTQTPVSVTNYQVINGMVHLCRMNQRKFGEQKIGKSKSKAPIILPVSLQQVFDQFYVLNQRTLPKGKRNVVWALQPHLLVIATLLGLKDKRPHPRYHPTGNSKGDFHRLGPNLQEALIWEMGLRGHRSTKRHLYELFWSFAKGRPGESRAQVRQRHRLQCWAVLALFHRTVFAPVGSGVRPWIKGYRVIMNRPTPEKKRHGKKRKATGQSSARRSRGFKSMGQTVRLQYGLRRMLTGHRPPGIVGKLSHLTHYWLKVLGNLLLPHEGKKPNAYLRRVKNCKRVKAYTTLRNQYVPQIKELTIAQQNMMDGALYPFRTRMKQVVDNGRTHAIAFSQPNAPIRFIVDVEDCAQFRGYRTHDGRLLDNQEGGGGGQNSQSLSPSKLINPWEENVFAHEWTHDVHETCFVKAKGGDPIVGMYNRAKKQGRLMDHYGAQNPHEYFAQGMEAWVMAIKNLENQYHQLFESGFHHPGGNTRWKLYLSDPVLFDFIQGMAQEP